MKNLGVFIIIGAVVLLGIAFIAQKNRMVSETVRIPNQDIRTKQPSTFDKLLDRGLKVIELYQAGNNVRNTKSAPVGGDNSLAIPNFGRV